MSGIDGRISGIQRRIATRKRSLTNTSSSSTTTATKKPRSAERDSSQGSPKNYPSCNSVTTDSSCIGLLAEKQPLRAEGAILADQPEGLRRTLRPDATRTVCHTVKTPTKVGFPEDIGSIRHKRPLFKSRSRCRETPEDSKPAGESCVSRGGGTGNIRGLGSPLVWPADDNDEEDWKLAAEIDSHSSRSAKRTGCQHSNSGEEEEKLDASFSSSPLPPTPQCPGHRNHNRFSSVKLPQTQPAAGNSQNNWVGDWEGDDSFYDRLDLDQLVSESQNPKLNGEVTSASSSGNDHRVSYKEEWFDSPSQTKIADCPANEGWSSPRSQAHRGNSQDTTFRKCSSTSGQVLTNGRMHGCRPPFTEETKSLGPTSETPEQEQWFSKLDERTRKCLNSESLAKSRSDSRSKIAETNSHASQAQLSAVKTSSNDPNPAAVSADRGEDISGDGELGNAANLPRGELTTPKVFSAAASKLRQRLQGNARVATPQPTRLAELRQARVQEALTEMLGPAAAGVRDNDIGPFYGLPSKVAELLKTHRGIDKLYDWQHSCLTLPAIRAGRNLIYSLPTSGGKTLVAEILIMRQLLCNRKDALLILPYVSIVQEKVASLSTFAVQLNFLVEEYAGSKGAIPPRKRRKKKTLYVATIEKAHSLVNSLILEGRAESLGLVVVDELHMLGDGGRRGASLESCIAKLLHLDSAHLIGMSATLSNIQDLCEFLRAEVYCSDFRPVELKEYIKIEDNIFEVNQSALCPDDRFTHSRILTFPYTRSMRKHDPDHLVGLALEVIPVHSCLVFCATKKSCQNVAEFICKHMPKDEAKKLTQRKHEEKRVLLLSLRRECGDHLCPTLKRTVPYGLAYHHSGLTMDERKLIEDAYSEGTLCLLACTSTLAAGVNLPAKRVILRSPYIAQDLLTSTRYKQMVGRAGRAGIDSSGESILIIKPKERKAIADLLSRPIEACYSSLVHDNGKGIRSLVLTLVALKLTPHRKAVLGFMSRTLFGVQAADLGNDVRALTEEGLEKLLEMKLIAEKHCGASFDASESELSVTKLGQAAFKGSIDIDLCACIYNDLKQACDEGLVLANSLHLLYLVTPYDLVSHSNPNWVIYDRLYSKLSEGDLRVAEIVGVTDRYLNFKVAGRKTHKPNEETDFRVQRFYLTLMLWLILNRTGVWDVASKFEVPRGFVQNLFNSAASFGSSVQRFCEDLPEFWAYQQLLTKVVYDLTYCATADLVSLLEVPGVKQGRAKQLVRAGYKTLRHLAHADPQLLVQEVDHLPSKVAQQIVAAAKMELAERAEALRDEAEELVTRPAQENETVTKDETRGAEDGSQARTPVTATGS